MSDCEKQLEVYARKIGMKYCKIEREVSSSSGKRADHILIHESGSIVVVIEHSKVPKKDDLDQIRHTLNELRKSDSAYRKKLEEYTGVSLCSDFLDIAYLHQEKRPTDVAYGLAAHFGVRIANCVEDIFRKLAEDLSKKYERECIRTSRRRSFCNHVPEVLYSICS